MTQVLEETGSSCINYISKLRFLQSQKDRLQITVSELQRNNRLMRHVNESISKDNVSLNRQITEELSTQNKQLQQNYSRILKQNERLALSLLLQQQILDENEQQHIDILHNYEEKIIELRRSIQMKEGCIQNLEERLKQTNDRVITPASNVNLLFLQEIEDLKRVIAALTIKNSKLEQSSREMTTQKEEMQRKMHLIETLTKSNIMFQQFKRYYYRQKKQGSAPKSGLHIPLHFNKEKPTKYNKLSEAETRMTRQSFDYSTVIPKDSSMKLLVYQSGLQNNRLRQQLHKIKTRLKHLQNTRKTLTESCRINEEKTGTINTELNYFKSATRDLMRVMAHRRQSIYSLQKTKEERIVKSIKKPVETSQNSAMITRSTYWKAIQQTIKIPKHLIQPKCARLKSLSCMLDYLSAQTRKGSQTQIKPPQNTKVHQGQVQVDFSKMIVGQIDQDVSVIHPANKHTYSEWKRSSQSRKKQAILGMSLIEEIIF